MFDFGNANDGQRQAIATADGPVLITAGREDIYSRATHNLSHRGMRCTAGKYLHCHIYGKSRKGTGHTHYKRTRKSKYHGKHQRNVYRYVPRTLPSYIERALGIHTTSPKLSLDGFV